VKIEGGLGEVGGAAEVAPIELVGAEGLDFLALGGETDVGGDDGEDAFFGEHGEEAGGDDVDAGEGKGLQRRGFWGLGKWFMGFRRLFRDLGKWRVASGEWQVGFQAAAAELVVVVEEEGAGGFAGLDG